MKIELDNGNVIIVNNEENKKIFIRTINRLSNGALKKGSFTKKHFTKEEDEKIKELFHQGKTYQEIAKEMNRIPTSVIGRIKRLQLTKEVEAIQL